MAVIQNLYQIVKIPSSLIMINNCNFDYPLSSAMKDSNVVAIGDNIVFYQIRRRNNDARTYKQIYNDTQRTRAQIKLYKTEGKIAEAKILNRHLIKSLFVPQIVNVLVKKKSDYKYIGKHGFTMNGIHYVRFCCGSGQMRRNTITFIDEKLYAPLTNDLMCGFNTKVKEFNLAKLHAYFALSFSSILWVRTPRVCVVKDYKKDLKNQPVDFITKKIEKDEHGHTHQKSILEERCMDLELNAFDGQGLVDPQFGELWAQDMNLSYTPASFVVRSAFVKGNLARFDFKKMAHEYGITTITDKWGVPYNIDDIDVILSESQFKMHKYYSSWQEYLGYVEAADIRWGVARYNKKYDDDYVLCNYQYIQALDLTREDIHNLVLPTVDWLQQVCSGDVLTSLLYTFGSKGAHCNYLDMYSHAQGIYAKAIVKNIDFLQDTFIQRKIYKNITESINKAKLGKIWLRGNYSFMIADPYAQAQWALGLPATGLLQADEVYSHYWASRDVAEIDLCRSPMIDTHEHNPCAVHLHDNEADGWYQYLTSGIVYNIYDTSCFRHSDSDYDGDIVLSTDNKYFIKGSHKDQNIITYEKGKAPDQKISLANSVKTDLRGLGTGVGGFSNCATVMYAMKGIFTKEEQTDQREEMATRIKLLREIVGQEIDRIKGTAAPELPSSWKHMEAINPDDTDAEKALKYKHNSMVIAKKPYFFRYLYPQLNATFKQYESMYNDISKDKFGIKFKKLFSKPDKTPEEMNLVRQYQKYCPLITSQCNMNILCKEFENVDFEIQYNKNNVSKLPDFASRYDKSFCETKLALIKDMYRRYNNKMQVKILDSVFENQLLGDQGLSEYGNDDDAYLEIKTSVANEIVYNLQNELKEAKIAPSEFLYYVHKLAPYYTTFNWAFAWDVLDEQIIKLIPQGKTYAPVRIEEYIDEFPASVEAVTGEAVEYLGQKYILIGASKTLYLKEQEAFEQHKYDAYLSTEDWDLVNQIVATIDPEAVDKIELSEYNEMEEQENIEVDLISSNNEDDNDKMKKQSTQRSVVIDISHDNSLSDFNNEDNEDDEDNTTQDNAFLEEGDELDYYEQYYGQYRGESDYDTNSASNRRVKRARKDNDE